MSKENVLLFGLGGIGGVYASILHLSNSVNVHVVARSNYEQVKEKGFKLVSPKFGDHESLKFAGGESLHHCVSCFAFHFMAVSCMDCWAVVVPS
jgi:ketopantoate reductase